MRATAELLQDSEHLVLMTHPDIIELDQKGYLHEIELGRLTPRIQRAFSMALYAHDQQRRKLADLPYVVHPYETMLLVAEMFGADMHEIESGSYQEMMLIAAMLHDTDEDSKGKVRIADIRRDFGDQVATIVDDVSKPRGFEGPERTKQLLAKLESTDNLDSVRVAMADKTHALICKINEHYRDPDGAHAVFNVSREAKIAYYKDVYEIGCDKLPSDDPFLRNMGHALDMYIEQQCRDGLSHAAMSALRATS